MARRQTNACGIDQKFAHQRISGWSIFGDRLKSMQYVRELTVFEVELGCQFNSSSAHEWTNVTFELRIPEREHYAPMRSSK
jgi:hypothetical protein